MRVIGSQETSTRFLPCRSAPASSSICVAIIPLCCSMRPRPSITGGQLASGMTPPRLLIDRMFGDVAQAADHGAVKMAGKLGGHAAARRLIHERHEFIREPRHGAGDADAADIGTSADAVHPSALGYVA